MLSSKLIISLCPLTFGLLCTLATSLPVSAAERIYLTYGFLSWSVDVASLETFAQDSTVNRDLKDYLRRTSPEEREKFRVALLKPVDINPVILSRFFNSEIGEDILNRFGKGITIQGGRNGKYASGAALIQAAMEPEGLTLLNVLRKLPTNMQLQGEIILGLAKEIDKVVKATKAYTKEMAELSAQEAQAQTPVNFAQLSDIRQPGTLGYQKETWNLTDNSRNRSFYVIVYKPQQWRTQKTPVVIMSHGLASNPESLEDVAQQLASYGYVVALPQHPGSDTQQAKALLEGYSREVFDLNEFINRPKDISYVIDELDQRNQSEFDGRLDLENVGVAGHSFGGYTALAVAGAEIDFDYLQQVCDRLYGGLNTSLLLQCRALSLPRSSYNFRDPRVKAVLGANPVNSAIFGEKGLKNIQIPIFFISGDYDQLRGGFEQLRSFMWLTTPNKYLTLAQGQAHIDFSELDAGITDVMNSVAKFTLPEPSLLKSYLYPTVLSFFEVYIANNPQYRPYLSSSYNAYLSQDHNFKVYMISVASKPGLAQAIQKFRAREGALSP